MPLILRVPAFILLSYLLGSVSSVRADSPVIELFITADSTFYAAHGDQTWNVIYDRINRARAPYQDSRLTPTIQLRITYIDVITNPAVDFVLNTPEVGGERDPNSILVDFNAHHSAQATAHPHDVALLFTGVDLTGSTLNYSYVGSLGVSGPNCGLLQATFPEYPNVEAQLAARDIGFILGVPRDGFANLCSTSGYLMSTGIVVANGPVPSFSDCSIEFLNGQFAANAYPTLLTLDDPIKQDEWILR